MIIRRAEQHRLEDSLGVLNKCRISPLAALSVHIQDWSLTSYGHLIVLSFGGPPNVAAFAAVRLTDRSGIAVSCKAIRLSDLALKNALLIAPRRVLEHIAQLPIVGADLAECDGRLNRGAKSVIFRDLRHASKHWPHYRW